MVEVQHGSLATVQRSRQISSCFLEPAVSRVLTGTLNFLFLTEVCMKSHSVCSAPACQSRKKKGLWEFCRRNNKSNPARWPHPNTRTASFHSFPCLLLLLQLTHFYATHNCIWAEENFPVCETSRQRSNVSPFNLEGSKWHVGGKYKMNLLFSDFSQDAVMPPSSMFH